MKIVNLESEGYSKKALKSLQKIGEVELFDSKNFSSAVHALKSARIVISRLRFLLGKELLDNAPDLKIVATPTTGTDHVDETYLKERGISFLSLKGERKFLNTIHATAEHTMALIFALLRHIPASCKHVSKQKQWNRDKFRGRELSGKTVGIIGYGRLGSKVASYTKAFGCRVLTCDIKNIIPEKNIKMVSLEELLSKSDIVSLHIDYNSLNHHFFSKKHFDFMKPSAIFINTSRGGCVKSDSLLTALENRSIRAAALDVMEGEVDNSHLSSPLLNYSEKHDNLLITPHTGGATEESMHKTEEFMAKKIIREVSVLRKNNVL